MGKPGTISAVDAYNRIGFLEFWREGLTHVVHRAIFGVGGGDEGVQVLGREQRGSDSVTNIRTRLDCTFKHTLDFGTAAFGLQAPLTTLSKEDIVEDRRGHRGG